MIFAGGGKQSTTQSAGSSGAYRPDPNLNAPGILPICKQPVTLKLGVPQSPMIMDWTTNYMTKQLESKGNFKLEFEIFPSAEYTQQLNLIVAAGGNDLPDIILNLSFNDSTIMQYGLAGAIIPLNNYLEHSAYFINEAKNRIGTDFIAMVKSPDGNVYTLPGFNQTLVNEYPNKLWIYQPWLDKLGLKAPETPKELFDVLKAFKTRDPNGNGIADEIPLVDHKDSIGGIGAIKGLIAPFQYVPSDGWFTVENGKVSVAYNTEGFREAMRYIHSLVAEDLFSPLSFTQDNAQLSTMINAQPTVVGMRIWMSLAALGATDPRRAEYKGIPPLKSANGSTVTSFAPTVAYPTMAISKNCKTPEAAFRFGDLMMSEEFSVITRYGEKGVDWLVPAPGEVSMYPGYTPIMKFISTSWGQPQNKWWYQIGPFAREYAYSLGNVFDGNTLQTAYQAAIIQDAYTGKHPPEYILKLIFTPDEERSVREIMMTLDTYVTESIARFAVGQLNVDRDWNTYLAELRTLGLDTMLPVIQRVYDRMSR